MQQISELLREADPLRHEPAVPAQRREHLRQTMLAAATEAQAPARKPSRRRVIIPVAVAILLIAAAILRLAFVRESQAAVRFEVRLAEDEPSAELKEVRLTGTGRTIYLHNEVIVTNSDIRAARVIEGDSRSQYWITVEFNAAGARKMRTATRNHVGKPIAILLNGQIAAAPVLRTPVDSSARFTGNFTKEQAQRIADGIGFR